MFESIRPVAFACVFVALAAGAVSAAEPDTALVAPAALGADSSAVTPPPVSGTKRARLSAPT